MTWTCFLYHMVSLGLNELNTVECHCNSVQYNKILHTSLQWMEQNINQRSNLQKRHHSSPVRASYGVSLWEFGEKIDHIITTPHCTKFAWKKPSMSPFPPYLTLPHEDLYGRILLTLHLFEGCLELYQEFGACCCVLLGCDKILDVGFL